MTTKETTETKKRTITLTDRPPVTITEDDWPVIAIGSRKDWDNQYEFQANRTWNDAIRVRKHDDGRVIVYGVSSHSTQFQGESGYTYKAGRLLDAGGDMVEAIHSVERALVDLGAPHDELKRVAAECIADLPAEEV